MDNTDELKKEIVRIKDELHVQNCMLNSTIYWLEDIHKYLEELSIEASVSLRNEEINNILIILSNISNSIKQVNGSKLHFRGEIKHCDYSLGGVVATSP